MVTPADTRKECTAFHSAKLPRSQALLGNALVRSSASPKRRRLHVPSLMSACEAELRDPHSQAELGNEGLTRPAACCRIDVADDLHEMLFQSAGALLQLTDRPAIARQPLGNGF